MKKINYKAIIHDSDGNILANTLVAVQLSIFDDGSTMVYQELHNPSTDESGIIVLDIGDGIALSGDFNTIEWAGGAHFLKTEINSGDGFVDMGTTELKSVPYAYHAETFTGPVGAEDNLMYYNEGNWVAGDALIQNTGGGQPQNNMQPYLGIYHVIALQGLFPSRNGAEPFIGEIMMVGFNFPPRGWANCDGQLLPIAQYTALFSLLGTTFGGDGRTTFGLPDLRGRTAIHPGTGVGLSPISWGERGGSETNTMTIQQMPSHTHTIVYQ